MTVSIVWQYMPDKALLLPLTTVNLVGPALQSDFTSGTVLKAENSLAMLVFYAYVYWLKCPLECLLL